MMTPWTDIFSGRRLTDLGMRKFEELVQSNNVADLELFLKKAYPLSVFDGLFLAEKAGELGNLAPFIEIRDHYKGSKFRSMFCSTAASAAIKEKQWAFVDYIFSEKADPNDPMNGSDLNWKHELIRKYSEAGIYFSVQPPAQILKEFFLKAQEEKIAARQILKMIAQNKGKS